MREVQVSSARNTILFQTCDNLGVDPADVLKRIAATLKQYMEASGLSMTDVHKQTGISRQTLYGILEGDRWPTLDVLTGLAELLGTTPGALIDGAVPASVIKLQAGSGKTDALVARSALLALIGDPLPTEVETRGTILDRLRRVEEILEIREQIEREEAAGEAVPSGRPGARANVRGGDRA